MKLKLNAILEGWSNYFKGSNVVQESQAKERATICAVCPKAKYGKHAALLPDARLGEIQGHYCGVCKCPLSTAVRSSGYTCPLHKW